MMLEFFSLLLMFSTTATDKCGVTFSDGWAPQAPPVATMWAGYGVLRNGSDHAVTLTGASSPDFAMAQLHETREENGVEHMRRIDSLVLPAGGEVPSCAGRKTSDANAAESRSRQVGRDRHRVPFRCLRGAG